MSVQDLFSQGKGFPDHALYLADPGIQIPVKSINHFRIKGHLNVLCNEVVLS